ncbi:MAG TPA: preprotein translocase subunit YajC [Croceibacterium sp.]
MRTTILRLACVLAAAQCLPATALAQDEGSDEVVESGSHSEIVPYIEVMQVFTKELEPGDDTVTYTSVAAGVDASIVGRNSAASVSLRYERRFGWEDDDLDGDTISGVARAGISVADGLTLEAGGLAAQTRVESNGFTSIGGFAGDDDTTSQIYSAYAGPSVQTSSRDVQIEGHYRLGYTRVEEPDAFVTAPGEEPVDIFDEGTTHSAYARVGTQPNTVLPVGVGVGAGYNQQDVSNLDQRIIDGYVRADVTVPVSPTLALVGGVGYEDVEISSRDAVRDANGNPVIGDDGRYVTDKSEPRVLAYSTEGLIWDVGVMWRPSRRTSAEFYVGERYGTMTYRGNFAYAPDSQTSFNVSIYDGLTGFGGMMVNQVTGLPSQFDALRNPITGEIGGCVAALTGDSCFANALGSVRSAVFRSRGIASSYSADLGRSRFGVGVGYDQREYIAAAGTVLESVNGITDETIWLAAYASTELDQLSSLSFNANASWFETEFDLSSDVIGYSASLAYQRDLLRGLSATAAVGLDGISRENFIDFMSASALLGLRYSFR